MMYLQTVWQRKSVTAGTKAHVTRRAGREEKKKEERQTLEGDVFGFR